MLSILYPSCCIIVVVSCDCIIHVVCVMLHPCERTTRRRRTKEWADDRAQEQLAHRDVRNNDSINNNNYNNNHENSDNNTHNDDM